MCRARNCACAVVSNCNKMARRRFAFYRELNNLSTADFLGASRKRNVSGPLYVVERIISRRTLKGQESIVEQFRCFFCATYDQFYFTVYRMKSAVNLF